MEIEKEVGYRLRKASTGEFIRLSNEEVGELLRAVNEDVPASAAKVFASLGSGRWIEAIKAVRQIYGLGLRDAKNVVDGLKEDLDTILQDRVARLSATLVDPE